MVPVDTGRRHRWSEDWLRCWLGKSLRCPRYLLLLLHPLPLHLLRGGSHLVHGHVLVAPDLVVVGVDGHEVVESDVDVGLLVGGQDGGLHDQQDSAGPDVQAVGLQDVSVNAPVDLSVIIQQDDSRVPVVGVHIHDLPEEKWNFKAHWSSLSLAPDPVSVELKNLRVLAQRPQLLQRFPPGETLAQLSLLTQLLPPLLGLLLLHLPLARPGWDPSLVSRQARAVRVDQPGWTRELSHQVSW